MGRNNTDALTDLNLDIFYQGLQEGAQNKSARLMMKKWRKRLMSKKNFRS